MRALSSICKPILVVTLMLGTSSATAAAHGDFDWPLRPHPVLRPFDNPAHDWLPGHRGVDLAGFPEEPVLSAGPGIVVFAGKVGGKQSVTVAHDGGLRTTYEPVRPSVSVGTPVSRGSLLGTLEPGHLGCPAPACLHWGLLRRGADNPDPHGEYLDPLGLLHLSPLRLKPYVPTAE